MRRARLNLVIDAVIGIAFLVTAVTGVVFLLPLSWQDGLIVGLSLHAWHWLHDWSGVVAAGGVALHLGLHYRWVVHTTRRWLAEWRREPAAARRREPAAARPGAVLLPTSSPGADGAPRSPEGRPDSSRPTGPAAPRGGLLTRRGFVAGAAGLGAALLSGGILFRVAAATDHAGAAQSGSASQGGTTGSSSGSALSGGTSVAQGGSSGTSTTQARVVVDSSSCIACGRCLQTCPASVFAWGGDGRATAQSPDRCILCHRCVQVCPASAITLNA